MNDPHFEDRLRASAPRVASPVGLSEHRQRIMGEVRARRRRAGGLWAGAAAVTVALLGGGTVAVAGNGMETPWGWTADNVLSIPGPEGQTCFAGIRVEPNGMPTDSEEVRAAREIVASIDPGALDISQRAAKLSAENGRPFDDGAAGVVFYTPSEIRQSAVFAAVADAMWDGLAARGLPTTPEEGVSLSLSARAMGCN
jgi:hypothetical protein